MYEIVLVKPDMSEPAVQVIGPFNTADECQLAMDHYNATAKLPGLCWLWSEAGKIDRAPGCLVSVPPLGTWQIVNKHAWGHYFMLYAPGERGNLVWTWTLERANATLFYSESAARQMVEKYLNRGNGVIEGWAKRV